MRPHLAALAAALALSLSSAGAALADTPAQVAEQSAGTGQSAGSSASSTQYKPSNSAISVRIGSPGSNGSVSQSNDSAAAAAAGNLAATSQDATQAGSGSGTQAAAQQAYTGQSADADATSTQYHPSNSAISVRIGSEGDDGDVSQSNSSKALALAGNAAGTTQTADQQGGSTPCCSSGGTQAIDQGAATKQSADATATSEQYHPSNSAISVRIGSSGDDGDVNQSNDSAALAAAGNAALTEQDATQDSRGGSCGCGGDAVQAAGQFASTGQSANADATSEQVGASNSVVPVRIGSPGDEGDVDQSNTSLAASFAGNAALTSQSADQQQGSGDGAGVQAIEQDAATWQDAGSSATSQQFKPTNSVTPVRINSPGDGGSAYQSNDSAALSAAGNLAATKQDASQDQDPGACGCYGNRVQAVGQFARTGQSAYSDATSEQVGASNTVAPVRIGKEGYGSCGCQDDHGYGQDGYGKDEQGSCGCQDGSGTDGYGTDGSYGDNGDVTQSNDSAALSLAGNLAFTDQRADQSQGASSCGCEPQNPGYGDESYGKPGYQDGSYDKPGYGKPSYGDSSCGCSSDHVQAAGQFAGTGQRADSSATSGQWWPANTVSPVRLGSAGSDGDVDQSNASLAKSLAFNIALTREGAAQQQ